MANKSNFTIHLYLSTEERRALKVSCADASATMQEYVRGVLVRSIAKNIRKQNQAVTAPFEDNQS